MKVMFVDWYYIGAENNPRNCLANLHWTPSVSVVFSQSCWWSSIKDKQYFHPLCLYAVVSCHSRPPTFGNARFVGVPTHFPSALYVFPPSFLGNYERTPWWYVLKVISLSFHASWSVKNPGPRFVGFFHSSMRRIRETPYNLYSSKFPLLGLPGFNALQHLYILTHFDCLVGGLHSSLS